MYVVTPTESTYHIAKGELSTICGRVYIYTKPNQRRRHTDPRLVAELPTDRICILCSECARLSGDTRSLTERITFPISNTKN